MTITALIERIARNDPTLTECDLEMQKISDISEFEEGLKSNRILSNLNLNGNKLGNRGGKVLAIVLKVNVALTELNLWNCNLTDIKELAESLKTNRSLSRLKLSSNKFGPAGGVALAGALKVNTVLTELDLDCCGLTDIKELADSLKINRFLAKLNLEFNQFGPGGIAALAGALKVNTALTVLDLTSCDLRDLKELAEALYVNRSLVKLHLGNNEFDSALELAFAAGLKVNTVLTHLDLQNCGLTDIKELADSLKSNRSLSKLVLDDSYKFGNAAGVALAGVLKLKTSLTDLAIGNCGLTDIKELADSLKSNRSLSRLKLSANEFGNPGGVALAGVLKVNTALTDLAIGNCGLTDIKELAESLNRNRFLSKLDLNQNKFGPAGGVALAGVLKVNTVLTELMVNFCVLTDIAELAESLESNRSLSKLDLSHNEFGPAGGVALAAALKVNSILNELDLTSCGLTDSTELAESLESNRSLSKLILWSNEFGSGGGVALAGVLKVNTVLTELSLKCCGLKEIKEFAESLKSNRSLLRLELEGNKFGKSGGVALAAALKVNSTLVKLTTNERCGIDPKSQKLIDEKIAFNRSLKEKKQVNPKERNLPTVAAATTAAGGAKVSLPPPTTAAAATAGSSPTAAAASLDEATIASLKALPGQHDALVKEVQKLTVIDAVPLEALRGRGAQFTSIFERDALLTAIDGERALIDSHAATQTYYQFFSRLLTGTWMACQTINSGLVQNSSKENLDYVGQGIDEIGKRIPVVSLFTGVFSAIISAWTGREKTIAVQRIALLFPDLETAFKELGKLARQLTLAQRESILTLESQPVSLLNKLKGGAKDLKATLFGEDVRGSLKRKAVEDCETLIIAIRDEKPKARPTVADLLTVVLGANFVYKPTSLPPATTATAAITSTTLSPTRAAPSSPQSPTTDELLERLRKMEAMAEKLREMEEKDREREAELKRMREKVTKLEQQKPDEEEEVSGGYSAQAQLSASKVARRKADADPATTAAHHAEVTNRLQNVETHTDVHGAMLGEQADQIAALKAKIKQLESGKKQS